ncbi:related to Integral membrane protein [Serendipita indica DSM 11827]|uniref:Glycerophosphocholine acyltransferase 1 n=1 Tax=Serendipita indica (strain DSM 11827) TaxID=1109443 RepID=G4TKF4_SERID|nr:related to Integral membrane protein [Serendipita indica DSM 11827]
MSTHSDEQPSRPPSRSSSFPSIGYFSSPFERWKEENVEWSSAYTLLDTFETFFDARIDLWERRLRKQGQSVLDGTKDVLKRRGIDPNIDRELDKLKKTLSIRMQKVNTAWHSTKVVRTREKISFFLGVHTVLGSALMVCLYPQWVHIFYTAACAYLLPLRFFSYKRKAYHYFLFDLCYYVTILNFVYIWLFPGSATLLTACYCLSHGSLASAVITWRNSLVFHDVDKVTSLFIHIYAPFTFTTIRHYYPEAPARFPALNDLPHFQPVRALLFSSALYMVWQILYWKFVYVDRKVKIESGQRTTSFSYLLADRRGAIGRALSKVPEDYRVASFMFGQFLYSIATEIPAVWFLYDSAFLSTIFLFIIFGVSVWNGGGFYIEVFGRKFEKELEALRKELAEMSASRAATPAASTPSLVPNDLESNSEAESDGQGVMLEMDSRPTPIEKKTQ